MSGKLLLKLEVVGLMLAHHTSSSFHFLDHPVNGRNRTVFYSTLARLLFMEDAPHRLALALAGGDGGAHGGCFGQGQREFPDSQGLAGRAPFLGTKRAPPPHAAPV